MEISQSAHVVAQQQAMDTIYQHARAYWFDDDPVNVYCVMRRLELAFEILEKNSVGRFNRDTSSILFLCAGAGEEAWACRERLGLRNVTFSDISPVAVEAGRKRDPGLNGVVLNAEAIAVAPGSYDVVVVQDGLHHLQEPTRGFAEMLRIAKLAAVFVEPADTFAAGIIGARWEMNEGAWNFIFRWNRDIVDKIAHSYLVTDDFRNLSQTFWHHNLYLYRVGKMFGGARGVLAMKLCSTILNGLLRGGGNTFLGIVVKSDRSSRWFRPPSKLARVARRLRRAKNHASPHIEEIV